MSFKEYERMSNTLGIANKKKQKKKKPLTWEGYRM